MTSSLKAGSLNEVSSIFEPRTVVIIGSSTIQEKVGMASPKVFKNVVNNMKRHFSGKTYVIDVESKAEVENLPETPGLAAIMLPPRQSMRQAEKCAKRGIKALIIITGGFTEKQRKYLLRLREEHDIRILGPNTILGALNTTNGLNTTFEEDSMPEIGNIAIISQSGGVGALLLDWACSYKIGISKFAFTGDKIDLDDVDLLHYLETDRSTSGKQGTLRKRNRF
jgi:acyl-CoA synthetase (NDP forming)